MYKILYVVKNILNCGKCMVMLIIYIMKLWVMSWNYGYWNFYLEINILYFGNICNFIGFKYYVFICSV